MVTAFQRSAFQDNTFQIDSLQPQPDGGGGFGFYKRKRKRIDRVAEETRKESELSQAIADIYDKLNGLTPKDREEVDGIVAKVLAPAALKRGPEAIKPILPLIDYSPLLAQVVLVERLMEIRRKIKLKEEEEEMAVLMLLISA